VVLNYAVTSNHIHLIVKDDGAHNVIPRSIGLIVGRTAREYYQRKNRKGAFREDRYHSTAMETGEHLLQCKDYESFRSAHQDWVQSSIEQQKNKRDDRWTKSIAVSGRGFTQQVQSIMGSMATGRKVREVEDDRYELREHQASYKAILRS
jgi:putative transposase